MASRSSLELTLISYRWASLLLRNAASQMRSTSTSSIISSSLISLRVYSSERGWTLGLTKVKQAWFTESGASLRVSLNAAQVNFCPMWYIFWVILERFIAISREIASINSGCKPTTTPILSMSLKTLLGLVTSGLLRMVRCCQQDATYLSCLGSLISNNGNTRVSSLAMLTSYSPLP